MPAGMSVSRPHRRRKKKKNGALPRLLLSGPASVVDLVTRDAQRDRKHFSPSLPPLHPTTLPYPSPSPPGPHLHTLEPLSTRATARLLLSACARALRLGSLTRRQTKTIGCRRRLIAAACRPCLILSSTPAELLLLLSSLLPQITRYCMLMLLAMRVEQANLPLFILSGQRSQRKHF